MALNFPHSIFDPLSCTGTQWIVDKVMIEHSLHSVLICDIHTARFQLDCSQAAGCPCTLFRVRCSPHSEGCAIQYQLMKVYFPNLICAGGKCTKNTSTLPGLARSPPSAVPGLRPGRVHNNTIVALCLFHSDT